MVQAMWTSLHSWNLIGPKTWVGLGNYVTLFKDPDTAKIFWHSAQYIIGYIPLVFVGGLAVALALNTALKGRNFFRGVYFLPVVTSWIAVSLVWRWLLNPHDGAVNAVLGWFGIEGPGWYTDPHWAMPSIIIASVWKDVGFIMVILLAGLQAIPSEIEEAAVLDGAGWWRRLISVTLPLAVAHHLLRAHHFADRRLPGLRPGLCDDRRRARTTRPAPWCYRSTT